VENVTIELNAAIEGGFNAASLDGAGKDVSGRGVQGIERGIGDRGHRSCSLGLAVSQQASVDCMGGSDWK
jgi:hypothetical protein